MEHSMAQPARKKARVWKGAAVLGAAAVISKLLGTLQKIPLQNIAGDGAYGIYNTVYPLYVLILLLATAGFPLAVSKFVAEYAARGQMREAERALKICSFVLFVTGGFFFVLLYGGAGTIAVWIGNRHTEASIRSVSFALWFVPFMAALRGYFQGLTDMVPTAVSQVAEQVVRVATMVVLMLWLVHTAQPDSTVTAGAMLGSAAGAVAGLLVMLGYWGRRRTGHWAGLQVPEPDERPARKSEAERPPLEEKLPSNGEAAAAKAAHEPIAGESALCLIRRFASYALPVCLGAIVLPMLNLVDSFTLPRMLSYTGLSESAAMTEFGIYSRGLPLVQLIALIAASMSAALVPAMAEAAAAGGMKLIRRRAGQALRWTWLIGAAASVGLAVTAHPINVMLFTSGSGSAVMTILAFTALFSSLNMVSASVLQGLGDVHGPARHLLLAVLIKIALNIALIPFYGTIGAAVGAVIAFGTASLLNIRAVRRITKAPVLENKTLARSLSALAFMTAFLLIVKEGLPLLFGAASLHLPGRALQTVVALTAVLGGAVIYGAALLRMKVVTEHDLEAAVPGLARKSLPFLRKLRLLQRK